MRPAQPTTAKQRGPLSLAAAVARSAKVVVLAPATQILLAEPELPPGSGVKLARAVPVRPRRAAHRRHRSAVLRARPAPRRRPHPGCGGVAQRAARLDFGTERRRHRAVRDVCRHLPDAGKSRPNRAVAGGVAARGAPPGNAAVRGGTHAGRARRWWSPASYADPLDAEASEPKTLESAILYVTREDWARVQDEFEPLADKFASLKVQLLPEGPLPWLARSSGGHRCRQSAAGRVRARHRLRRALAPVANRRRCSRRRCWSCTSPPRRCRFTRPTARRQPSTARSPRCFRRRCPPKRCTIRAARCNRVSSAFAAPEPGPEYFLRSLQALSGAIAAMPNTIIDTLSYREQTLDMKVTAPSLAALSQLSQLVGKQGLTRRNSILDAGRRRRRGAFAGQTRRREGAPMNEILAKLKRRYAGLQPREQRMVRLGAVARRPAASGGRRIAAAAIGRVDRAEARRHQARGSGMDAR